MVLVGFAVIVWMLNMVARTQDSRTDSVIYPALIAVTGSSCTPGSSAPDPQHRRRRAIPTLRAAEALVLMAAMFLAIFAMIYVMISQEDPSSFTEPLEAFTATTSR